MPPRVDLLLPDQERPLRRSHRRGRQPGPADAAQQQPARRGPALRAGARAGGDAAGARGLSPQRAGGPARGLSVGLPGRGRLRHPDLRRARGGRRRLRAERVQLPPVPYRSLAGARAHSEAQAHGWPRPAAGLDLRPPGQRQPRPANAHARGVRGRAVARAASGGGGGPEPNHLRPLRRRPVESQRPPHADRRAPLRPPEWARSHVEPAPGPRGPKGSRDSATRSCTGGLFAPLPFASWPSTCRAARATPT